MSRAPDLPPVPKPIDGELLFPWLPFATCNVCDQVITLGDDGLAGGHLVPCGRPCRLSPVSGDADTCGGACMKCWKVSIGCDSDPDRPCGRRGCHRCTRHMLGEFMGKSVCGNAAPTARIAWAWADVKCSLCLAKAPPGETAASLAVRSIRRSLQALAVAPERASLAHRDGAATLQVRSPGTPDLTLAVPGDRRVGYLTVAARLRAAAGRVPTLGAPAALASIAGGGAS